MGDSLFAASPSQRWRCCSPARCAADRSSPLRSALLVAFAEAPSAPVGLVGCGGALWIGLRRAGGGPAGRGVQMGWDGADASANDLHLVLFNAKLTPPQLPPRAHFLP